VKRIIQLASVTTMIVVGLTLASPGAIANALDPSSIITTVAGTGVAGYSGDGSDAATAQLNQPRDSDVGPDGSIYIVDTFNNAIRKITPDGIISTLAGTGAGGYGGDDGPATEALLHFPHDVAVDQLTNDVYIADSNNKRIRKVSPDGIITTVAGNGLTGPAGDGHLATAARLNLPKSVALYNNGLYIADSQNHKIRMVDLTTGIISTVAGTGVKGFSGDGGPALEAMINLPQRLTLDPFGNIYFTDTLNNRIRKIDTTGTITTLAGTGEPGFSGDGGLAVDAQIKAPRGIAVSPDASIVYFSDTENNRVRQIDSVTGIITTVAGNTKRTYKGDGGPAVSASLYNPRGLTLDTTGRLLIADKGHNVLRAIAPGASL
jgi:DNA-binding beta-propeller fold protein YncE